jgi:hypothetical protein
MKWIKRGVVFEPSGQNGWMNSHAQVPTVLAMEDRLRIYFASRPNNELSLPTFVDVDRTDPARILSINPHPILDVGKPGTFDADGVMPSCVVRDGDDVLMYYSGWCRLGGKAPYNNATGLAVSKDGGVTFARMFDGPILDRTPDEPWSATSPAILRTPVEWRMWYSSGTGWVDVNGKLEHIYVLKEAFSADGAHWTRQNRSLIETKTHLEAQTRPAVIFLNGRWHMWFSYRGAIAFRTSGETYRLGYAWSDDLITWHRDDDACGINVSPDGWDAQMICYPDVVQVDGRTLMFYNGNAFGKCGFGYAVLQV